MDSITSQARISWLISVYDRTAEEFFKQKRYIFSYERASEEEIKEVMRLCCKKSDFPPKMTSPKIGDAQVSYSIGSNDYTDPEIIKYRHLFDFVDNSKKASCCNKPFSSFHTVNLKPDSYYEDENGKPISYIQMMDEELRRKNGGTGIAIIKGHPESILRLEPVQPLRKELWNKADADVFALFFKQLNFILQSRWINSPCQISPISKDKCYTRLPLEEDCMAVMLPFRQIYSKNPSDDLFNKVCKIFKRHCPKKHITYIWIEDYHEEFNAILEGNAYFPMQNCNINVRRFLNAFAYGAKVVHVKSKEKEPAQDLNYLLNEFQREKIIMQYHVILRNLMGTILMVHELLRKNIKYWISNLGWEDTSGGPIGSDIFN